MSDGTAKLSAIGLKNVLLANEDAYFRICKARLLFLVVISAIGAFTISKHY
jgi:hypothetical protein